MADPNAGVGTPLSQLQQVHRKMDAGQADYEDQLVKARDAQVDKEQHTPAREDACYGKVRQALALVSNLSDGDSFGARSRTLVKQFCGEMSKKLGG